MAVQKRNRGLLFFFISAACCSAAVLPPRWYLSTRRMVEYQRFLMLLSVRPGSSRAISLHLVPTVLSACTMRWSSSALQCSLFTSGLSRLCHLSLHCLGVRPGTSAPMVSHLMLAVPYAANSSALPPYSDTRRCTSSSSALLHGTCLLRRPPPDDAAAADTGEEEEEDEGVDAADQGPEGAELTPLRALTGPPPAPPPAADTSRPSSSPSPSSDSTFSRSPPPCPASPFDEGDG